MEVILSQNIDAHGETVEKLTFKKPTVEDINRTGMPFDISPEGLVVCNTKNVSTYISKLAEIPPSSVKQLTVPDWMECYGIIMSFFGTAQGT